MNATQPAYRILSRLHVNQWDNGLQQTVAGWQIKAQWFATGTILPVFVPDASYTAVNVDALIRDAGARDEQMHALGG